MKKKLRILAAGDLHGSKDIARTLAKKARKEQVDLIILAGDIAGLAGRSNEVLEPFKKTKQKLETRDKKRLEKNLTRMNTKTNKEKIYTTTT